MVMKIVEEIQRQIYELGNDGRLVEMQLERANWRTRKRRKTNNKRLYSTRKKKKNSRKSTRKLRRIKL